MEASLSTTEPIAPQLVALLRKSIVELQLAPGSILSEKELAARFNVSRQPVREAFIKLSEAGLVEIRPSRGTWVLKISVREVANARFVREAIESDLARYAASLAAGDHLAHLRDLVGRQKAAAEVGGFAAFNVLDEEFHRAIAGISQNDFALRTVEAARFQTDRVRLLSLPGATPLGVLIDQHEAILDRIEAGDGEGAAAAMRRHLREILLALPNVARAHPAYFTDLDLPEHARGLVPEPPG